MPTVRKSSIAASRPIPQKYIPYHADNYERGKRTGITVDYVETSDDFEPFEKVLSQADKRTPPRPKIQKKKRRPKTPKTPVVEEEEFDEDGEMDMELEESTPNGPSAYFASARIGIQSSVPRVGSSTRPVHRSSDIDYDAIPSPRLGSTSSILRRPSIVNGRPSHASRLSRSTVAHEEFDEPVGAFDDIPGPPSSDESDNEHMISPPPPPSRGLSRRTSFQQLGRDSEEQEEERQVESQVSKVSGSSIQRKQTPKPRGKQPSPELSPEPPDVPMQDDFDTGMSPMDEQPPEPEEEPQEETPKADKLKRKAPAPVKEKPKKKSRRENEGPTKPRSRDNGILKEVIQDSNIEHPGGVRRSRRARFAPLEYWRMERVVYGHPDEGKAVLPVVKEILRVPKEEPKPLGAKKKKRGRAKSTTAEPEEPWNPEEGWDEGTPTHGPIWSVPLNEEVEKHIIQLKNHFDPRLANGGEFEFEKFFGDETFVAAGQIKIAPKKSKPTKGTKDNTFIFYVIQGAVRVHIHNTSYTVCTGGSFMVPRGNMYFIQNICQRDVLLFFAQARKIKEGQETEARDGHQTDGGSRSRSRSRSHTLVQKDK